MDISPSRIVRQGLGLEPEGIPLPHAALCCMCGIQILAGELGNKASISPSFTDDAEMAHRGGDTVCADCTVLMGVVGLRESGFGMFNLAGFHPFRKWADIAACLLNPPEPPFVACYATSKSQHMAWRAPVNLSRDAFRVRVGARSLLIRRQRLIDAPAICERVAQAVYPPTSEKKGGAVRKTLPHPFLNLAPDLKDLQHGQLTPRVMKALKDALYPELEGDVQWLRTLTVGETWALRFVLTPGAGQSQQDKEQP